LLHGALAAAAAGVFEAAPFVLAAGLLPRGAGALASLLACGCGGRLPAALSLPALGLCWIAFGPAVTLARTGTALATLLLPRALHSQEARTSCHDAAAPDPLRDLAGIGLAGFAGALAAGALPPVAAALPVPAAFLAGAGAGALLPCGTAGLVLAGTLHALSPAASAGMLASAGILTRRIELPGRAKPPGGDGLALALIATACLWLALQGGRGFLSPRFAALSLAGWAAAMVSLCRGTRTTLGTPALLPATLIVALALGSPPPGAATATLPVGLYPGLAVDFTGTVRPGGRAVGRAAMLCCRADAQLLILPLAVRLRVRDGSWVRVRGTIQGRAETLRLEDVRAEAVAAPADPFVYL